jgi:tetratricopeptide (TPR) repeat protein
VVSERRPEQRRQGLTEAIRLDPRVGPAYNNLAWIFGTCPNAAFRNGPKAVEYAKQACELTAWKEASFLDTLAAAYAESGNFEEAIKWQEKVIDLTNDEEAKAGLRTRLALYKEGKPFRDEPKK